MVLKMTRFSSIITHETERAVSTAMSTKRISHNRFDVWRFLNSLISHCYCRGLTTISRKSNRAMWVAAGVSYGLRSSVRLQTGLCFSLSSVFARHSSTYGSKIELTNSVDAPTIVHVTQGGNINIVANDIPQLRIEIVSAWQDHCEVICSDHNHRVKYDISHDSSSNSLHLIFTSDTQTHQNKQSLRQDGTESYIDVRLKVPEICNLNINGANLNTRLKNKIMGDVIVQCTSGTLEIDKVKGERIMISLGKGDMKLNKSLEGTTGNINCRDFYGKMLHVEKLSISSTESTRIEALYTTAALINSQGNINIDLMRGNISATAQNDLFLKGVDGSFATESLLGRVELQINKLAIRSKSSAVAKHGNVLVKIDPKVTAALECVSLNSASSGTRNSITISSTSFSKQSENATKGESARIVGILNGIAENDKDSSITSGKINVETAELQSLQMGQDKSNTSNSQAIAPALRFESNAHIRVESLSWMDVIRLKHGMSSSAATAPTRLGRTGRAKQEALGILKNTGDNEG